MLAISATEVRKDWGSYIDTIVREKPIFVKRSRDYFACMDIDTLKSLVSNIKFNAEYEYDEDNKVVMFIDGYDAVVTGSDVNEAKRNLITDLKEYAQHYFEDAQTWNTDKKRAGQINELLKLSVSTDDELMEDLICQPTRN